jgi:hypothetical protein
LLDIETKIKEATKYAPLERLGACPQVWIFVLLLMYLMKCGFETGAGLPNAASVETQWGKLGLLGKLRKNLWGQK